MNGEETEDMRPRPNRYKSGRKFAYLPKLMQGGILWLQHYYEFIIFCDMYVGGITWIGIRTRFRTEEEMLKEMDKYNLKYYERSDNN